MTEHQRLLRFQLSARRGDSSAVLTFAGDTSSIPPGKLFADLLKRQARRVMADVTECPPETIPAHMVRLAEVRETIEFAIRHELIPGNETQRSDKQLIYAATVKDFLACLEITRQQHRAPVVISDREEALVRIERKIDLLAGVLGQSEILERILDAQ